MFNVIRLVQSQVNKERAQKTIAEQMDLSDWWKASPPKEWHGGLMVLTNLDRDGSKAVNANQPDKGH